MMITPPSVSTNVPLLGDAPPPPHDPEEREHILSLGEWQARVLTGPRLEYFAARRLMHVQLWHPASRVSILTPSRLTADEYEAFPVPIWKFRTASYERLALRLAAVHGIRLPPKTDVLMLERALVQELSRSARTKAPS